MEPSNRLFKLYKRRVDTSLPDAPSYEEWRASLSKSEARRLAIQIGEPGFAEDFILRLKDSLGQLDKSEVKQVGVVAVMDGDKILMGKRQDNGKWTNPGGHLEDGEKPKDGALRELKEEAGLEHESAKKMISKKITAPDGVKLVVHAYEVKHDGQKPTGKYDPDNEVKKWEWIDTKNMPKKVLNNLHSPKNVILEKLGILKSLMNDLLKSAPHKYLRKYKRGSRWVYVYHEGTNRPRQIPEEAIKRLKELADLGDEHAKSLYESLGEYSPVKLQLLRELADAGDVEAKRHLKENHAIDREQEKLEDSVGLSAPKKDDTEKTLNDEQKTKLKQALNTAMGPTITHLGGHLTSPFATSLESIGGLAGVRKRIGTQVQSAQTIKEALTKMHEIAKDMDRVQPDPSTSANSTIRNGGGYGSVMYNEFVRDLEARGLLPEGYSEIHKRTRNQSEHSVPLARELAEKAAQKRAQREEEERRALAEIHGSMAHHMTSLMGNMSSSERIEKAKELDRRIRTIFGKSLRREDWPYDFPGHKTVIKSVNLSSDGFSLEMQVVDPQGNNMMESWTRRFSRQNGRPYIYNAYMKVKEGSRGGLQIGNLINQGQRKLMRSIEGGGVVEVTANIDVGGYTWANQGFSFRDESQAFQFRNKFKNFLTAKGIYLSDEDMRSFKEPFHIAAFTDGKKYIMNTSEDTELKLSEAQLQTRSLSGVAGEHPLTESEIRNKRSSRMAVNLGKMFLLLESRNHHSWSGRWDSAVNSEASKFADKFYEMREQAVQHANHAYQDLLVKVKSGERTRTSTPSSSATPTSSTTPTSSSSGTDRSQRLIRRWSPASGNIRITKARATIIAGLPDSEFQHFLINSRLTRAGREMINAIRRGRNATQR